MSFFNMGTLNPAQKQTNNLPYTKTWATKTLTCRKKLNQGTVRWNHENVFGLCSNGFSSPYKKSSGVVLPSWKKHVLHWLYLDIFQMDTEKEYAFFKMKKQTG